MSDPNLRSAARLLESVRHGAASLPASGRVKLGPVHDALLAEADLAAELVARWTHLRERLDAELAFETPASILGSSSGADRLLLRERDAADRLAREWARLEEQLLGACTSPARFEEAFARHHDLRSLTLVEYEGSRIAWDCHGGLVALENIALHTVASARSRSAPRMEFTFVPEVPWTPHIAEWVAIVRDAGRTPVADPARRSVTWPVRFVADPRPLARLLFLPEMVALEAVLAVALAREATP
jgi:hypothetical protein